MQLAVKQADGVFTYSLISHTSTGCVSEDSCGQHDVAHGTWPSSSSVAGAVANVDRGAGIANSISPAALVDVAEDKSHQRV